MILYGAVGCLLSYILLYMIIIFVFLDLHVIVAIQSFFKWLKGRATLSVVCVQVWYTFRCGVATSMLGRPKGRPMIQYISQLAEQHLSKALDVPLRRTHACTCLDDRNAVTAVYVHRREENEASSSWLLGQLDWKVLFCSAAGRAPSRLCMPADRPPVHHSLHCFLCGLWPQLHCPPIPLLLQALHPASYSILS